MKVRKLLFTLLLLGGYLNNAQAQDATVATGGEASGAGGVASYSIGQPMYLSHSSSGAIEMQGVQQPFEISTVTGVFDADGIGLLLSVYPSPTSNELNLKIDTYPTKELSYQLVDMSGKVLQTNTIDDELTRLSLSVYATGSYFLSVLKNGQLIKSFKIVKTQ